MNSITIILIIIVVILLITAIVWFYIASQKLSISLKNVGEDLFAIKVIYTNETSKIIRNVKPGITKNIMFKLNDNTYVKSIIIQPESSDKIDVDVFIEMNLLKGSKVIKKYLNTDDVLTRRHFVSSNNWAMERKPDDVLRNLGSDKIGLYWVSNKYDSAWPFIISDGKIAINNNAITVEGDISGALIDLNVDAIKKL